MGAAEHAGVSTLVLLATVALSTVGLVTLATSGYGLPSLVFVFTFTIPVFTIGLWRLRKAGRSEAALESRSVASPGEPSGS